MKHIDFQAQRLGGEVGKSMTTSRGQLIKQIEKALGRKRLYWFGTRGGDATSLADIPQFSGSFSIIDKYNWALERSISWEELAGYRVDLDNWEIDNYLKHPSTQEFHTAMLAAMSYDSALIAYRPCGFLSDLSFVRNHTCDYLGLFSGQQSAFEYKPWVETSLSKLGIDWLEWSYLTRDDIAVAESLLADGSVVMRPSRGSGGYGMIRVDSTDRLQEVWPTTSDGHISVSRYRYNCLPINVGAVVWKDGVTVHFPSVQLIGVPACTAWRFGYCGNDFGYMRHLPVEIIEKIEWSARVIGNWLCSQGFLGAFGIDYLFDGDKLLFTEINPRFQGSTRYSSQLSAERGEPCILLDHIAAFLGLPCPERPILKNLISDIEDGGQFVIHNTTRKPIVVDTEKIIHGLRGSLSSFRAVTVVDSFTKAESGATLMTIQAETPLTQDGYSLNNVLEDTIRYSVNTASKSSDVCED